jgi:hypothetical protein
MTVSRFLVSGRVGQLEYSGELCSPSLSCWIPSFILAEAMSVDVAVAISAERDQIFVSIVTQQTSRAGGGPEDDRNCRKYWHLPAVAPTCWRLAIGIGPRVQDA